MNIFLINVHLTVYFFQLRKRKKCLSQRTINPRDTLYVRARIPAQTSLGFFFPFLFYWNSAGCFGWSNSNHQKTLFRSTLVENPLARFSSHRPELGPGNFRERTVTINPHFGGVHFQSFSTESDSISSAIYRPRFSLSGISG